MTAMAGIFGDNERDKKTCGLSTGRPSKDGFPEVNSEHKDHSSMFEILPVNPSITNSLQIELFLAPETPKGVLKPASIDEVIGAAFRKSPRLNCDFQRNIVGKGVKVAICEDDRASEINVVLGATGDIALRLRR